MLSQRKYCYRQLLLCCLLLVISKVGAASTKVRPQIKKRAEGQQSQQQQQQQQHVHLQQNQQHGQQQHQAQQFKSQPQQHNLHQQHLHHQQQLQKLQQQQYQQQMQQQQQQQQQQQRQTADIGGTKVYDMYPWNGASSNDRNDDILDILRGDSYLDMNEEITPRLLLEQGIGVCDISDISTTSFSSSLLGKMFMRNMEGRQFVVTASPLLEEDVVNSKRTHTSSQTTSIWGDSVHASASASSSQSQPSSSAPPPPSLDDYDMTDASKISKRLEGVCAIMPAQYWDYEWCHRIEIRQYHVDRNSQTPIRSPDWSLGKYQHTIAVRERGDVTNTSAAIVKLVDHFSGGQHCDENGKLRSTEVHIQCCERVDITDSNSDFNGFQHQHQQHQHQHQHQHQGYEQGAISPGSLSRAMIRAVVEPELCSYQMVVCTSALCPRKESQQQSTSAHESQHIQGNPSSSSSSSSPSGGDHNNNQQKRGKNNQNVGSSNKSLSSSNRNLVDIFSDLSQTCLTRLVDWWTYELCFGSGIRQLHVHVESTRQENGIVAQSQVITASFSLGLPPQDKYSNETALEESITGRRQQHLKDKDENQNPSHTSTTTISSRQYNEDLLSAKVGLPSPVLLGRVDGPPSLLLEFENGTACDLVNVRRGTTVELTCGPKDIITDIIEDSTCHYHFKVQSTILCSYQRLAPKKVKMMRVRLEPLAHLNEQGRGGQDQSEDGDGVVDNRKSQSLHLE